jgi:hypothetical protein
MKVLELLLDPLKTLPGFAWVLALVTLFWTRMTGVTESTEWRTLTLAGVCWVAFRTGAVMDELYDGLYRPQRLKPFRWKGEELIKARNAAATAVLGADYDAAGARGQIFPSKKFYALAKTLAKNTEHWEKKIARLNDWSKMARTFFIFSLAGILLLLLASLSLDVRVWIEHYTQSLWFFGTVWAQALIAIVSVVAYLELRLRHNIELYSYVAKHVVHVKTTTGEVPYIFEDIVEKRSAY